MADEPPVAEDFRVHLSADEKYAVLTFTDALGSDTQIILPGGAIVAFAMQLMKTATDKMVRQYGEASRRKSSRDETVLSSAVGVVTSQGGVGALVIQTSDHYQIRVGVSADTLGRLATELARAELVPMR